jgi:hypothetical protein
MEFEGKCEKKSQRISLEDGRNLKDIKNRHI